MSIRNNFRPDFLGIGTIRSGSSFLADMLMQHPQIQWASRKEVNYFNQYNPDHTLNPYFQLSEFFYRRFFPESLPPDTILGEYSPIYMADEEGMKRIKEWYPEIQLIATLRHPVTRSFSHYRYAKNFLQDIPSGMDFETALQNYPYLLELGNYSEQLDRLFSLFPGSNIQVIIFEEMINDPSRIVRDVYQFLGFDPNFEPLIKKVNANKKVKNQWVENSLRMLSKIKSAIPESFLEKFYNSSIYPVLLNKKHQIRDSNITTGEKSVVNPLLTGQLLGYYREDIERTQEILGRRIPVWES